MKLRRSGISVAMVTTALFFAIAAAALADNAVPLGGSPLNVYVGERGQLQAVRTDTGSGIFYPSSSQVGDAGFFLAFPEGLPGSATEHVYGFEGNAGPHGLDEDTPGPPSLSIQGAGTAADPLKQVTTYAVPAALAVTQTTTYVNGAQEFRVRWDVNNIAGEPVKFKALAAADFFFEGDDAGTGIFTAGPPRFIGGTNLDSGSSGGFVEVIGGGIAPWSAYQALRFGSTRTRSGARSRERLEHQRHLDDSVLAEATDNAGGVEWDQDATGPGLAPGATRSFELVVRSGVPSALQLNPTNGASRQGVPINITATAVDSNGQPYAGKTLSYSIAGPNAATGGATLNATGSAVITDPGAKAGTDTVTAFVDFNGNGTRDTVEPQASAQATFVDSVPPNCSLKASGTLSAGGESGKPLVIKVSCGEAGTVTLATTLEAPAAGGSSASASKKVKIKLKPVKKKVKKGKKTAFKIKIPKSVAHKYAGKTLKAKIKVTAKDKQGNKKTKTSKAKVKFAKLGK